MFQSNVSKIGFIFLILLLLPCFLNAQTINMDQALTEAVTHNPELISYEKKFRAAGASIWEAGTPGNPNFFMEYEGIPESSSSLDKFERRKIGIQQGIEFPLTYYYQAKKQHFKKRMSYANYLAKKQEIQNKVKKAFYKIILLKNQYELHENIYTLTQEMLQKARIRVVSGEASAYDTLKVKVDLAEVENHRVSIEKEYELALSKLNVLMGRDAASKVQVAGQLKFRNYKIALDSLLDLAGRFHPSLVNAQNQVYEKRTEQLLSWTSLLPDFELKYFKIESQDTPGQKFWGGELGISVPLFIFVSGQGKIRKATYNKSAAELDLLSKIREVQYEIRRAYSKMIVSEKHVRNYQKNTLQQVEELVRIATRSYEEGEMGYLEIAEALRSMNRGKVGYIEALYEYISAQADLEMAVGTNLFEYN